MEHFPDDSFYYLVLAKHFALHGRWTFDGVAPATGFHLLWGYLLSALYFIHPTSTFKQAIAIIGFVEVICHAIAATLTASVAMRLWGRRATIGVTIVFLSAASLRESAQLMETSLVILVAAAFLALVGLQEEFHFTRKRASTVFILGVAGTLARTDFGLLPFWIFIAYTLLYILKQCKIAGLRLACIGLLGSLIGNAVVAGHTYLISGHLMQSSAEVKVYWTKVAGPSFQPALQVVNGFLNPVSGLYGPSPRPLPHWGLRLGSMFNRMLICGLAVGVLISMRKERHIPSRVVTMALIAVIASYIIL